MRSTHQRLISTVGAVAFGALAVICALRGEALSTVMAVLAAAVAIACVYQAVRKPNNQR